MAEPDSLANVETLWAKEANTEGLKKAPVGERRKCPFQLFLTLFFLVETARWIEGGLEKR